MITRTTATVLRVSPFSKTSHIVTWLTQERGLLTTTVRGACRPRSPFLGQYDLFYTCELLYYAREKGGVHVPRECSPLVTRPALRTNWRAAGVASYLAAVCLEIAQPHHEESALFDALNRALDALEHETSPKRVMLSFELAALHAAGLAPNLAPCPNCPPDSRPARFCIESGHWLCQHRPSLRAGTPTIALPEAVTEAIRQTPPGTMLDHKYDANLALLSRFLGLFLRMHLDSALRSRNIALQLLNLQISHRSHAA